MKTGEQQNNLVKLSGHVRRDSKTSLVDGAIPSGNGTLKLKIRPPSASKNEIAPP
jgi:hypothetical protein